MTDLPLAACAIPALLLLATGLVPSRWAKRGALRFRRLVTVLAGFHFLAASLLLIAFLLGGGSETHRVLLGSAQQSPVTFSLYYDGSAGLMLALVSLVGWVICRYSNRYLDGEKNEGRYYRWTAFTIGAVSLMVISGNLLMFFVAWVSTSLGLHKLLLHYAHRPAAHRAAWTKFSISRLGDVALISAIVLTYFHFHTFEFAELFASVQGTAVGGPLATTPTVWIAWLIVFGAVTKSAQFPFHTWLPQTMETPTPVSALMHAGIVNAGGYLIIRTSPLITHAPLALMVLAVVGAVTACFAATVMLTQTSVKRSLAYSTIAQMGFMMLQCGLGAFSAAMLHIVAHSLYKAHAFLSSGGVLAQRAGTNGVDVASRAPFRGWLHLPAAAAVSFAAFGLAMVSAGIDPATKAGGFVLGLILCLAFTAWLWQAWRTQVTMVMAASAASTGLLALIYAFSFVAVDKIVTSNPAITTPPLPLGGIAAIVAVGFGSLFVLQPLLLRKTRPHWLDAMYVHASNGFYIDAVYRRLFGPIASS